MNRNNLIAVMIVLALLLGAVMLYASADLMGSMNPDPHSHRDSYSVTGSLEGEGISGTAICTPVRENGAFYNYDFRIDAGAEITLSFFLIFNSDEEPFNCIQISDDTYRIIENGYRITFTTAENCLVEWFSMSSDSVELEGILTHSEVFS